MGDPRKLKKQYTNPKKRWDKDRIDSERRLIDTYGLRNKKELRKVESMLRKKRQNARNLLALPTEERKIKEQELLQSLHSLALLPKEATLDDVLSLKPESLLERRLQTISWRKGLSQTPKQARQFIVHGHIAVNKTKVNAPGYIMKVKEEKEVGFFKKPIQLVPPKKEAKEELKKKFEDVSKAESIEKAVQDENASEPLTDDKGKGETEITEQKEAAEIDVKKEGAEQNTESKEELTNKDEKVKE